MEFDSNYIKKLKAADKGAVGALSDLYIDKMYSYALLFFGDEKTARLATKACFRLFLDNVTMLTEKNTVPAAVFGTLKKYCDNLYLSIKQEHGAVPYNTDLWQDNKLSESFVKILSELNRKERSLVLLCDVVCLTRDEMCEIYEVEQDEISLAISYCRDAEKKMLEKAGGIEINGNKLNDCAVTELLRRDINDFIDGALGQREQEILFGKMEELPEAKNYLDVMRFIKRSNGELLTEPDNKVKNDFAVKTAKKIIIKKHGIVVIILTAFMCLITLAAFALAALVLFTEPESDPSSSVSSEETPSSGSEDESDDVSDISQTESETESKTESQADYTKWLPDGIDEYLPHEYRGTQFKYLATALGHHLSSFDNNPDFEILNMEEIDLGASFAIVLVKGDYRKLTDIIYSYEYYNYDVCRDYNYDGLSEDAEYGIFFLRNDNM